MPVTTTSAAIHIAPVVVKTFFKHTKKNVKRLKASKDYKETPQDDILFDQAFHIVKAFITLGTKNTIESLQAFTNTHVPAPPWAAVSPVLIPLKTCNDAADQLIEWFGPEELKHVVGGERWWQVRGMDGIDGEWIAEMEDIAADAEVKQRDGKILKDRDANIMRMERLETVMLYVHGGGYFWGSINTHRYQIIHYAHKFKGRAFAVNYRKAPQYPWPCPLQDVLAAYLYLIRPPPEALHRPIDPTKIVFAGDSAGGGLCLTVLTVLRDLGLPMPAGAVLISPWVDLTHSFPSVMQNYETDIIPKHGFLAKPSTLWPIPTVPEKGGRVVTTVSNEPPEPGKADTLKPSPGRVEREEESEVYGPGESVKSQQAMLDDHNAAEPQTTDTTGLYGSARNSPMTSPAPKEKLADAFDDHEIDHWEPKPPKVLMDNPNAVPLELRSQIQMYASTELLTHPLVSPILQGSLGDLPPLYILAGDGEVLRDEIVYLAHKAAHPGDYPTRPGVLRDGHRQSENVGKFTTPTKVHLQIFDGMCHVLTVFMFTKSAKYAYRSIAEFTNHVTRNDADHLARNPFPELHRPPQDITSGKKHDKLKKVKNSGGQTLVEDGISDNFVVKDAQLQGTPPSDVEAFLENQTIAAEEVEGGKADTINGQHSPTSSSSNETKRNTPRIEKDIPGVLMLRERVDLHAKVRPMEPRDEISGLKLKNSQIGIIKEAPTLRWNDGQEIWDKRYAKNTAKVLKQKAKCEAKAMALLQNAVDQGFIHDKNATTAAGDDTASKASLRLRKKSSMGKIQVDRRWGPLDLEDEHPPASAIAGRRDTPDAVALLKKSIYHTAPVTHRTIPKLKASQAIAAAFDPNDDPNKAPRQSASEQQVTGHLIPMHGLRMWDNILRYLGRKSSKKANNGIHMTAEKLGLKGDSDSDGGDAHQEQETAAPASGDKKVVGEQHGE